jgi:hypothetical protein
MTKINLDIGHALSREDQRRNRRQPYFMSHSLSPLSPEIARRGSQKKLQPRHLVRQTGRTRPMASLWGNRASRLVDRFSAGKMLAGLAAQKTS